ncbi:MAG: peptidoglycan editing factor PgeF [Bryobacteraceae bacterium]
MERGIISPAFVKGADGVYRCVALEEMQWLEHGFTTRRSASSIQEVTTLRQIHSATVLSAAGLDDRACEGDALISSERGKRIGVRSADCVPILLADSETRTVAAIHAGWRGTAARIASKTVERMQEDFGTQPRNVIAAIGPSIGVCCYEVGSEVRARFADVFPELAGDGRVMLDLVEANRRILRAAGVPVEQIHSSGLCTCCSADEFFSYRRDPGEPGRMISFVGRLR